MIISDDSRQSVSSESVDFILDYDCINKFFVIFSNTYNIIIFNFKKWPIIYNCIIIFKNIVMNSKWPTNNSKHNSKLNRHRLYIHTYPEKGLHKYIKDTHKDKTKTNNKKDTIKNIYNINETKWIVGTEPLEGYRKPESLPLFSHEWSRRDHRRLMYKKYLFNKQTMCYNKLALYAIAGPA